MKESAMKTMEMQVVDVRTYLGQWERNHLSGAGLMQSSNDLAYRGGYLEDGKHGIGILISPIRSGSSDETALIGSRKM